MSPTVQQFELKGPLKAIEAVRTTGTPKATLGAQSSNRTRSHKVSGMLWGLSGHAAPQFLTRVGRSASAWGADPSRRWPGGAQRASG